MAFTSGTATNYHTLLTALKTYLVACGWTVLSSVTGTLLTDLSELHIGFPGVDGFGGVLNIRTNYNTSLGYYGWQSSISQSYSSSNTWGTQQNESPTVFTNMWDSSLGYWFYVNDRRVIMSLKVSSVYASAFWGMFLPFATPEEYNYPYYIGSNFTGLGPYAPLTIDNNFFIASPIINTAFYQTRGGVWTPVTNRKTSIFASYYDSERSGRLWPYGNMHDITSGSSDNVFYTLLSNARPNAAGQTFVFPVHLISHSEQTMVGVLDGVYAVPGFNLGTEQQITMGSRTFRVFQDLNRTTGISYMAIEEL